MGKGEGGTSGSSWSLATVGPDNTVDQIMLTKLCHYGVRELADKWFESYLAGRKQLESINGFESHISSITCGISQGSVLGPLPFPLCSNKLL